MARINLISFFKFYEIKVQFRCNDVAKRYNFLKHTTCITKDIDKYSAKHLKKFETMSLPQIILTDLPHISFLFYNYYPLLKFKRSLRTNLLFSQSHWFSFNFYKTALLCVDFFQCFKHMSRFWAYSHFTLNPLQYTLTPRRQMIIVSRVFSSDLE